MIIMPNVQAIIETEKAHVITKYIASKISEGFIEKKVCKKLTKEFIKVFNDELDEGSRVYVEAMFLIVHGDTLDNGTCCGCTVYSHKVKFKE